MRKLLLLLLFATPCYGACTETIVGPPNTWTAATASNINDWLACLPTSTTYGASNGTNASFVNGDTVAIPAGTITFSSTLVISAGITLRGNTSCTGDGDPAFNNLACSGVNATTVNANSTGSAVVIQMTGCSNTLFQRVTGFTFVDQGSPQTNGKVQFVNGVFDAVCFRFDHNSVSGNTGGAWVKAANAYGLIDLNVFADSGTTGLRPPITPYGGNGNDRGYGNWNEATNLGSNQAIYIERNTYTEQGTSTEGFWDSFGGAKVVCRFNTIVNSGSTGNHGTDSGDYRSTVLMEFYGNLLTNNTSSALQPLGGRGGLYMVWGNTMSKLGTAGYSTIGQSIFRLPGEQPNLGIWGTADGITPWTPFTSSLITQGYTHNTVVGAADWQASHGYATNAIIAPTANNNKIWRNTAGSCTSSSSQPVWNSGIRQTPGQSLTDNTCTWLNVGGVTSQDWQASFAYLAGASIAPTSSDAGNYNFELLNAACTSGSSRPAFNQTIGGNTSDGTCTSGNAWQNFGVRMAAGGWCSNHPDTIAPNGNSSCPGGTATRLFDTCDTISGCLGSPAGYPFRDQPGVGHDQVVMGNYEWLNGGSGFIGQPFFGKCGTCTSALVQNRDYFDYTASFTGAAGVGSGTFASIPATCTVGVAYWATDQGTWNVSSNGTGNGQLYKCTSTNTFTLYYTPLTYPHPLTGTGTPTLSLSPTSLTFPDTAIGTVSTTQTSTLHNTGVVTLNITSIAAGTGFSQTNNCGSSLAAGASCQITVTFTPINFIHYATAVTVNTNAPTSPDTVSLTGNGIAIGPTLILMATVPRPSGDGYGRR